MKYVIFLEKAFEKEDKTKKPLVKKEEEDKDEKEEKLPPRKKGTDIGSNVGVGHKILVGDGEDTEAEVTAVGQHGVTAKDSKGNKHQILHQHVKKQDGQDEDEEEDEDDEKWGEDKKDKEGKESKSRKDESVTVEEFLKQEKWKTGEWIQASMLARLMETSLKDVKEQLLDLSNTGLVQLVSEDNLHGDLLYKFTNAKRAPHEAKATKVPSGRNEDTQFKQPGKNKK